MLKNYVTSLFLFVFVVVISITTAIDENVDNNQLNEIDQQQNNLPQPQTVQPPQKNQQRRRHRSHRHQNLCRREFLRPLEKRIFDVDIVFKGVVERVFNKKPTSLNDLDSNDNLFVNNNDNYQRKRHLHPMMIQQQLQQMQQQNNRSRLSLSRNNNLDRIRYHRHLHPSIVAANADQLGNGNGHFPFGQHQQVTYRAIVRVKRILRGDKNLQGTRVIIEGFGTKRLCESDVSEKDIRIFLVNRALHGRLHLNSSVLKASSVNMKKVVFAIKSRICRTQDEYVGKARCKRLLYSFEQPPRDVTKRDTISSTTPMSAELDDGQDDFDIDDMLFDDLIMETTRIPINITAPRKAKKVTTQIEKVNMTTNLIAIAIGIAISIVSVTVVILFIIVKHCHMANKKGTPILCNEMSEHGLETTNPVDKDKKESQSMLDSTEESTDTMISRKYWSESDLS